jgi:hypothetical protein
MPALTRTADHTPKPAPGARRSWPVVFAGSGLLLLSLYFAYAVLWSSVRQFQAARFVPVQATILESRVEQDSVGTDSRRIYHPGVRYTYNVGGEARESTQLYFLGPSLTGRMSAQAVADRYVAGAQVTAYHDPHDPDVSVLDNTPRLPPLPLALLVLVQIALPIWLVRRGWRPKT